jgi:guanylate kinase
MLNGIIISGCSGVGKSTVIRRLLELHLDYTFSISCTTRKPRKGEIDGVHYHFIDHAEFERRIEDGYFLEWEKVYTDYYGTPKTVIDEAERFPKVVIFELDIEDLAKRLSMRGSEDEKSLAERQLYTKEELHRLQKSDYAIINRSIDDTVGALETIILSLNHRTRFAEGHIEGLLKALK